ncbi:site-2 protease family protein [Dyella subtropica]|uniref:site-2 protease family protein n=1 Tax=Dyella subtropica TaxID=2992127 RepID=UPI00225B617D|nr:site-2 protease family protein [Dyella subtropica]
MGDAAFANHQRASAAFSTLRAGWGSGIVNWLAGCVQILIMLAASAFGIGFGMAAWRDTGNAFAGAMLLWAMLYYPAMIVHELGHYFGARLAGMAVLHVRLSAIEIRPQQRGFRMRWNPIRKQLRVGGYVMAFSDPARPRREQVIALASGGPAVNLALAVVLVVAGWAWLPHRAGWLCEAFAAMNAGMGFANLVPRQGIVPSDGRTLLQALRHRLNDSPQVRLISLSVFGCTADRLPGEDLVALEAQASPLPLVALWYRLKAHQNRGEWKEAVSMRATLDERLHAMDQTPASRPADLIAVIQTEIAFSQAMVTKDAAVLVDGLLPPKVAWDVPFLWPRCLALRAALAGDMARCVESLVVSRRYAENAIDQALPISERMIRASMAASFGDAWSEEAIGSVRTA